MSKTVWKHRETFVDLRHRLDSLAQILRRTDPRLARAAERFSPRLGQAIAAAKAPSSRPPDDWTIADDLSAQLARALAHPPPLACLASAGAFVGPRGAAGLDPDMGQRSGTTLGPDWGVAGPKRRGKTLTLPSRKM